MHWRRKWQPTPVFLPGESQGQRSLVGCRLWVAQSRTWLTQLSSSSNRVHHNLYAEKCWTGWSRSWNQDCWEKYQLPQICRRHQLYARKQRGTEEPRDENERGAWKPGLTLNIQKTEIIASGPIISWQIDGETMEIVTDFIFGDSKITADDDCSHEIN